MTPMKKAMVFSGLIFAPLVLATIFWLGSLAWKAQQAARFGAKFTVLQDRTLKLSIGQVEDILGQPLRIDHAESTGVSGDVYHFATYPAGDDLKVVFINGVLFHTELLPPISS